MSEKIKPTCQVLESYIFSGYSLRKIGDLVGYSVTTLSKLCEDCGIEKPSIGRPKGFKLSNESKEKIARGVRKD